MLWGRKVMTERMLTPEQAAERLALTPKTVREWILKGTLPAAKMGRLWRIREADLDDFIRKTVSMKEA